MCGASLSHWIGCEGSGWDCQGELSQEKGQECLLCKEFGRVFPVFRYRGGSDWGELSRSQRLWLTSVEIDASE